MAEVWDENRPNRVAVKGSKMVWLEERVDNELPVHFELKVVTTPMLVSL